MNTSFKTQYKFLLASYMAEYMFTKKRGKKEDKLITIFRTM